MNVSLRMCSKKSKRVSGGKRFWSLAACSCSSGSGHVSTKNMVDSVPRRGRRSKNSRMLRGMLYLCPQWKEGLSSMKESTLFTEASASIRQSE